MATKADFSPEEWETLQWAVSDTTAYLSLAHPGFWESFKEAGAAAKYMGAAREGSSTLVRDLAGNPKMGSDPTVTKDPADIADHVADRLSGAVKLVSDKAPDEVEAFKAFIVGLAEAAAAASGDVDPNEEKAIDKVKAALA